VPRSHPRRRRQPARHPAAETRTISVANRHPRLRCPTGRVVRAIELLDANSPRFIPRGARRGGCPPGELSLVFLSDAALAKLHADFLADPAVTDVITFAGDSSLGIAGEICVSADAARRQGGTPPAGFSAELTLYFVHGWLHLAGYDDLQPAKKREMRRAEARAMKMLREADAVPVFGWR
jgi:probable rRNA maturation factor